MPTSLKIRLQADPPPTSLTPEEATIMLDGIVDEFDADYQRRCKEKGLPEGRLLSGERSLLKSFVMFLSVRTPEEP
jgi:hypothetical protein